MTKKKKSKSKGQNSGGASQQQQQHHKPAAKSQSGASSPSPSASSNTNLSKKRKRSIGGSDNSMPANAPSDAGGDASALIIPHVIQWLEKRKMKIPDALSKSNNLGASSMDMDMDMDRVLSLLPSLRERERRALIRHVDKCLKHGNGSDGNSEGNTEQLEGSDGEYDIHEKHTNDNRYNLEANGWPSLSSPAVEFSNNYKWDTAVPSEIKTTYSPSKEVRRQRANRLSNRVYFKRITDPNHPAHGEYGLYCNIPHATPGMWLLDYVGYITLGEHQDKSSDYVSDFGERSELACDANSFGNEARFLNDFRNTGNHPNVEFNKRRDKNGELRQGVYVKLAKDAKQKGFDGVRQHEELLVSYGKSYWRSRVGNLTDFVWRLPGQPVPEGGKPDAVE